KHMGKAKLLAGGTNLFVDMRSDLLKPEYVIDIKKVPGVKEIKFLSRVGLSIGPGVTCNELIECKAVEEKYPLLIAAAKELASYQIRNRATVAGNICYASPAADMAPALLILGAKVKIASIAGEDIIPLKDFFKGVKKTLLQPEEFVKALIIPEDYSFMKALYKKSKRVKGHDLSIVSVAMGRIKGFYRIAIGSCGPTPVLLEEIPVTVELKEIISKALKAISPIDDLRGSADYRRNMVEVYIKRIHQELGGKN
ncbi:MAG TPA: xanthine dehydrogenase family protein subunit M, partial [Candidatus Eremiobacteraeota bacterium]|nr:xanthine dehydrogenase family protein subunit M [Candidatus Eremiobacteraeota bacterium]